ncbi:hypothetical protein BOX15_Mlig027574g6 [Macrostomum lignano]|uniref:Uncharacterized protein n=2 Tax=Macrostomum lignano TaxID=282301 RepID=A0A267GI15_9PLAT|nr:hypothetical protein BOX15_Mlig027574g6 [Macrostomum lignano]
MTALSGISSPLTTAASATPQSLLRQQLLGELNCGRPFSIGVGDIGINRTDSELLIDSRENAANEAGVSSNNIDISDQNLAQGQAKPLVAGHNNSSQEKHNKYVCPEMPETSWPIGHPVHVELRSQCRMCLRPDRHKYVTLNFRVMRHDSEMHVGQIVNLCGVKRNALYAPIILDRWTRTLRLKIKATIKISLVFSSIAARLGLRNSVGLKYCLDGFYGVEAFGDAFGNYGPGICPWMEVTGDASPLSLKLEDNDNIYMSIATEKMIELVRARVEQAGEQAFKNATQRSEQLRKSRVSFASLKSDGEGNVEPLEIKME